MIIWLFAHLKNFHRIHQNLENHHNLRKRRPFDFATGEVLNEVWITF